MLGEVDLVREPLAAARADGQHDGADARLRRRRARAGARVGGRHAPADGARRRGRERPRRVARTSSVRSTAHASIRSTASSTPSPASTRPGSPPSSRAAGPCGAGRRATTSSAASARSAGTAPGADPRRSGAVSPREGRSLCGARLLDVPCDLRDELGLARERHLVAEPLPELDDEPLPVEIALPVEQERLDAPLGAAVVRVDADRDGRAEVAGRAGVDPEAGDEQIRLDLEVGGREPERAAPLVAADDDPLDLDGPPEQSGGLADLAARTRAGGSGSTRPPRRSAPRGRRSRGDGASSRSPAPLVPEAKAGARNDDLARRSRRGSRARTPPARAPRARA